MKMKTKIKKLVCLMLSAMMVLAMSLTGYADEENYTITIKNAKSGHTYEAYQVFSGKLVDNVLTDITWGSGVARDALLSALKGTNFETDGVNTDIDAAENAADIAAAIEGLSTSDAEKFAQVVGQHLSTEKVSTDAYDENSKNYKIIISKDKAGYYFVKDEDNSQLNTGDAYTSYILEVVNSVEVTLKSDVPTVEKKVKENIKEAVDNTKVNYNYGTGYNDVADYSIGDSVPFILVGTLPVQDRYDEYDTYYYEFNDTLSAGLTNKNDAKVYVVTASGVEREVNEGEGEYTIVNNEHSIKVTFNNLKKVTTDATDKIVVKYTARLNEDAAIGLPGNDNKVDLTFSNNPNQGGDKSKGKTPEDYVIVFTYKLEVTKVNKNDMNEKLNGAEFLLYRDKRNESGEIVTNIVNGQPVNVKEYAQVTNNKISGWTTDESSASTLTSAEINGNKGLIQVIGLDAGIYYLHESKAPAGGYNTLVDDITFTIDAKTTNKDEWTSKDPVDALKKLAIVLTDTATSNGSGSASNGTVSMNVENGKGATLPSTGGIGTTIFYIIGGLMMLGAAIVLITKKRVADND